jgi:hypothetical protein
VNTDKLYSDAKVARLLAEAANIVAVDNGSANLDATFFRLTKGQRADAVVKAFRSAGLSADPTRWIGRGVMVQPPGTGQAGKRHAANQALYESLQRSGWPVTPFYQMD